jgi:taurine dioxygenase
VAQLGNQALREILDLLYTNRFVVLKTGGLDNEQLVEFARRIGDPIEFNLTDKHPEILSLTNVGIDTKTDRTGAAHWHTDQSFKREMASITMLYSVQAPDSGGATNFCDMAAAYNALPSSMQKSIEGLMVEHRHGRSIVAHPQEHTPIPPTGWDQSRRVFHPLVRAHPMTGQRALYAVSGTSQGIKGMATDEAAHLLSRLLEHALQPEFVTSYKHVVHDLVMWDNPTTMHSATPIKAATGPRDTREIKRISLRGTSSVYTEQAR